MKIALYTDIHWSEYSSVLRSEGEMYSTRLEYLIKSMNWAERKAEELNCDSIVCLGDFFNRPDLNATEITSLQEINWSLLPHYFIVGNHESSVKSLKYKSTDILKKLPNFTIVDTPLAYTDEIMFLPYVKSSELDTLTNYWNSIYGNTLSPKKIIFSHNDVKGIQMGMFLSKEGVDVDEIDSFTTAFINGHLHNGTKFSEKGINLGNFTGQNFSEDAFKYEHDLFIFDTEKMTLENIENPYAFNFYQLEISEEKDLKSLDKIKNNSLLSIKCVDKLVDNLRSYLDNVKDKVAYSRVMITREIITSEATQEALKDLTSNHLLKFTQFVQEKLDNTDVLQAELLEVCK